MPRYPIPKFDDEHRRLLEDCFRREAGSAVQIPGDDVDLVDAGILDSMGWVSFLRAVETVVGLPRPLLGRRGIGEHPCAGMGRRRTVDDLSRQVKAARRAELREQPTITPRCG